MSNQEDFAPEGLIEKERNGKKYSFRILNGKDSNEMAPLMIKRDDMGNAIVNDNGNAIMDTSKRNEQYIKHSLVEAPYECNGKPWHKASTQERWETIQKLKREVFDWIVGQAIEINDLGADEEKKLIGPSTTASADPTSNQQSGNAPLST